MLHFAGAVMQLRLFNLPNNLDEGSHSYRKLTT